MRFRRPLLFLSAASGIIYLLTEKWQPYPGSALIKGSAVGFLALLAFLSRGERRDAGLFALGLAFSAAGDILLDLDPSLFVFGLGSFLMTHLTYTCVFLRNRTRPFHLGTSRLVLVVLVVACAAALSAWIVPSVGGLAVPVVLYICAITTMVVTAISARFKSPGVAIGAVLFLISDSVLAVNKFKTPVPFRDLIVWTTYYFGQIGIALGFCWGRRGRLPH